MPTRSVRAAKAARCSSCPPPTQVCSVLGRSPGGPRQLSSIPTQNIVDSEVLNEVWVSMLACHPEARVNCLAACGISLRTCSAAHPPPILRRQLLGRLRSLLARVATPRVRGDASRRRPSRARVTTPDKKAHLHARHSPRPVRRRARWPLPWLGLLQPLPSLPVRRAPARREGIESGRASCNRRAACPSGTRKVKASPNTVGRPARKRGRHCLWQVRQQQGSWFSLPSA
jgi:hypothetical protein